MVTTIPIEGAPIHATRCSTSDRGAGPRIEEPTEFPRLSARKNTCLGGTIVASKSRVVVDGSR